MTSWILDFLNSSATTIVGFMEDFVVFLIELLPSSQGLPTEISTAIEEIVGIVYGFDIIIPVDTLLTALLFVIGFEISMLAVKTVFYLAGLVRSSS